MATLLPSSPGISSIKVDDATERTPARLSISWLDAAGEQKSYDYFGSSARRVSATLRSADAISQECRCGVLIGIILGKTTG